MSIDRADESATAGKGLLATVLNVQRDEWRAVLISGLYFFFILSSYYVVRPVRDALASGLGADLLRYPITITFIAMLAIVPIYGWLASNFPRRKFLPWVYLFFIVNMVGLAILLRVAADAAWLAAAVWVWVSIFNLFVVAVFWSFMADIFDRDRARRLFGIIAAGGSLGAITGPTLSSMLVEPLGVANMPLISAALLCAALVCLIALGRSSLGSSNPEDAANKAMGGSALAGAKLVFRYPFLAGLAVFMALGTFTGTLLYLAQLEIISQAFDSAVERTAKFSWIDQRINIATLLIQLLLMGRLIGWVGLGSTLLILPIVVIFSFAATAISPTMAVITATYILRRALLFGVANPAAQMLYTVVGPQSKYKVKHFIDTFVWRGGDTLASWSFAGLAAAGLSLGAISTVGIPLAAIWAGLAFWLGRRYHYLRDRSDTVLP